MDTFRYLEQKGFRVTYLPVNKKGLINVESLKNSIDHDTLAVSIMFINNEIGTI